MSTAFAGVAPVFLIIAFGWVVRATGLIPRAAWHGVNRLAYWVMFPAILFGLLAGADLRNADTALFLLAVATGFLAMGGVAMVLRLPLRQVDGPGYSSLFQVCVRWNGFVILAVAPLAFDDEGVTLSALMFAAAVPVANVLSVWALSTWGARADTAARDWRSVLKQLAQNPLILACAAGVGWSLSGAPTGGPVFDAISLVGRGGLATALLGVGAGLSLEALRARPGLLALGTGLKLLVMPLVMVGVAIAFGLSTQAIAVMAAIGASPSAAGSYILAREMGGDAELTAGYVTATTLLSVIALPLAIGWALG